jgi:hypothetical protein
MDSNGPILKQMNKSGSYSNLFLKKKEQSNKPNKHPHNGGKSTEKLKSTNNTFDRDSIISNTQNGNDENIQHYYNTASKSRVPTKQFTYNQIDNIESIDYDRRLSPKQNYKFKKAALSRCQSQDKYSVNNRSIYSTESGYNSSVHYYMQRRHNETQAKLQKLRNEREDKELGEVRDRPHISRNSRKIVEEHMNNNMNVVERLTSPYYQRKKEEEASKILDMSNKNTNKPQVSYCLFLD